MATEVGVPLLVAFVIAQWWCKIDRMLQSSSAGSDWTSSQGCCCRRHRVRPERSTFQRRQRDRKQLPDDGDLRGGVEDSTLRRSRRGGHPVPAWWPRRVPQVL